MKSAPTSTASTTSTLSQQSHSIEALEQMRAAPRDAFYKEVSRLLEELRKDEPSVYVLIAGDDDDGGAIVTLDRKISSAFETLFNEEVATNKIPTATASKQWARRVVEDWVNEARRSRRERQHAHVASTLNAAPVDLGKIINDLKNPMYPANAAAAMALADLCEAANRKLEAVCAELELSFITTRRLAKLEARFGILRYAFPAGWKHREQMDRYMEVLDDTSLVKLLDNLQTAKTVPGTAKEMNVLIQKGLNSGIYKKKAEESAHLRTVTAAGNAIVAARESLLRLPGFETVVIFLDSALENYREAKAGSKEAVS